MYSLYLPYFMKGNLHSVFQYYTGVLRKSRKWGCIVFSMLCRLWLSILTQDCVVPLGGYKTFSSWQETRGHRRVLKEKTVDWNHPLLKGYAAHHLCQLWIRSATETFSLLIASSESFHFIITCSSVLWPLQLLPSHMDLDQQTKLGISRSDHVIVNRARSRG